ncbi:hypothetical protein [Nostoc sp. 106C]|uniref:hypothetical protein n=1 Tax=Nostoc sp. 106C TaxID=1932667 RepID=UPI000A3D18C3|nr:hypothetical protein [Nostoc sp. 106C]OUL35291.1 hypothetical protein BV375_02360 [Nostoc sp. 106C]
MSIKISVLGSIYQNLNMVGSAHPTILILRSLTFKRIATPKRQGYLWDGLLNRSVFISYVLEIGFLLFMAAIAPKIWK